MASQVAPCDCKNKQIEEFEIIASQNLLAPSTRCQYACYRAAFRKGLTFAGKVVGSIVDSGVLPFCELCHYIMARGSQHLRLKRCRALNRSGLLRAPLAGISVRTIVCRCWLTPISLCNDLGEIAECFRSEGRRYGSLTGQTSSSCVFR